MKKIIIVTRNLPPLIGGMENLNLNMALEISKKFHLTVIGPCNSNVYIPNHIDFIGVPLKPFWLFLIISFFKALITGWKIKPSIILGGSGLMAPAVFFSAKMCGAKSITYIHGLDIAVKNIWYKKIWIPFIIKNDHLIANSSFTKNLIMQIKTPNNITVINPGLSEKKEIGKSEADEFRKKYNLDNSKILISVGRLAERKGIREFIEHCLPKILDAHRNLHLIIIGDTPTDSLYTKGQSKSSILETATKYNVQNKIIFLGTVDDKTLQIALSTADIHIFPIIDIEGDPEGFGMVAIEAASHGTPTIAFSSGGVVDAVENEISGSLITPNDYTAFTRETIDILESKYINEEKCKDFSKKFLWREFREKIILLLCSISTHEN